MLTEVDGLKDGDIKNIIDEYQAENAPPDGFYPVSYFRDIYGDDMTGQKMAGILDKMYRDKKAERSDKKHYSGNTQVWFYRISENKS